MDELYELHFHGNRQEIESEKLKKRELMSYFPKRLGTVDETKYVLQDDDKNMRTTKIIPYQLIGNTTILLQVCLMKTKCLT